MTGLKPFPQYDFRILVSAEGDEHARESAGFYNDMFDIELNHAVHISVMPAFSRSPWPPRCSEDALVSSADEARRCRVAAARFSITPESVGSDQETFLDEEGSRHSLFYTSSEEHDALVRELTGLLENQSTDATSGAPVSEVRAPILKRLLLDRIIPSGELSSHALSILGRARN